MRKFRIVWNEGQVPVPGSPARRQVTTVLEADSYSVEHGVAVFNREESRTWQFVASVHAFAYIEEVTQDA